MADPSTTAVPGDSSIADVSPTQGAAATPAPTLVEQVAAQLATNAAAEPAPETPPETPPTPEGVTDPPAPPGSSERQIENWQQVNAKIRELEAERDRLRPMAERVTAIEPFQQEIDQFLALSEVVNVDPEIHGRQFERLIYEMNPALWQAMVRRAGTVYAQDLGLVSQQQVQPPAQRAPAPYPQYTPAPPQQGALQIPEFTAEELEDRRAVYGDEEVARIQALLAAAQAAQASQEQIHQLQSAIADIRAQATASAIAEANDRHDAQFSEEISNQIGAFVPRYITVDGRQEWNPEFVALWKYFDAAFDRDEVAKNARELSREAYRAKMKGAQPKLTAAVRSHIGNVITRDIAPLVAARAAPQLAQTEQAREVAAIPPSPVVGAGAAPPAPGQAGMSLVDQIALVKARKSTG